MSLRAVPLTLREANAYVAAHHRHSDPTVGCKWAFGCHRSDRLLLCGVLIAGRPVARALDDGRTLEVLRCCTDGTLGACSFLYARAVKAAREMGYRLVITYTLAAEPGTSLRAMGARPVATVRGRQATCPSRPRKLRAETPDRVRWELWRAA